MGEQREHWRRVELKGTIMAEENRFDAQGIKFKTIKEDKFNEVLDFLNEHFCPAEPITRSMLGLGRSKIMDHFFLDALKQEASVAAYDKDGALMGIRIAQIEDASEWGSWLTLTFLYSLTFVPTFLMPGWLKMIPVWVLLAAKTEYDVFQKFRSLGANRIYDGRCVCSARFHGVKGLGTELVLRGNELAKSKGCSHTFLLATGNYSTKLFKNMGYTQLKTLVYDEFRDSNGELYLKDTREHISCSTFLKEL